MWLELQSSALTWTYEVNTASYRRLRRGESKSAVNANRRGTAMTDSCVVMVGDFNHTSLTTVLPKLKQCMV